MVLLGKWEWKENEVHWTKGNKQKLLKKWAREYFFSSDFLCCKVHIYAKSDSEAQVWFREVPERSKAIDATEQNKTMFCFSQLGTYRVMIAGGGDEFWLAVLMPNEWCRTKHKPDLKDKDNRR